MKTVRVGPHDIEFCHQAANLHIRSIHHGLLPLLGTRFLAKMYRCLAAAPQAGVWARADGERLVGFVAGCASVRRAYRWLLIHHGPGLAFAAGRALLRAEVLAKLGSVIFYPLRRDNAPGTALEAELLAIAIDADEYGKGHAKSLVQAFEASLLEWGVSAYRVLTNAAETESNAFYRASGFAPAGTLKHHALTLQVYEKTLVR